MVAWKRNLAVIWVAELLAIAGFAFTMPFVPYYIQELGVTDLHEVELWSGALIAAQAVPMAIFAPIWGSVADRYGRKLMVQRATFGGAVVLSLMGFTQSVEQLFVLRVIQGVLTGTVPAATALVASTTPRERSGYALGLLQMAIFTGASIGPLIGGLVADSLGYRAAFWVTGGLLFMSGLTVWLLVEENFEPVAKAGKKATSGFREGLRLVVRDKSLLSLFGVRALVRMGTRMIWPILPLFIQTLAADSGRIASLTGLITAAGAAASAIGAVILGRMGDQIGFRRILLVCAAGMTVLYLPHFLVSDAWQLLILQVALGLVMSGVLASVSAMLAKQAPEGREGAVFGVDASVVSMANAVGPMLGATTAATLGIRVPFLLASAAFAVATVLAWVVVPRDHKKRNPTTHV
jgi:DHA1 family multidrug resistance protein-like MFS transporter